AAARAGRLWLSVTTAHAARRARSALEFVDIRRSRASGDGAATGYVRRLEPARYRELGRRSTGPCRRRRSGPDHADPCSSVHATNHSLAASDPPIRAGPPGASSRHRSAATAAQGPFLDRQLLSGSQRERLHGRSCALRPRSVRLGRPPAVTRVFGLIGLLVLIEAH